MVERAAVILAGGCGRRLGNVEKALIPIRDKTLIEHVIEVLDPLVDEIIVSARDEEQAQVLEPLVGGRVVVVDGRKGVGPLAGILSGLEAAKGEYTLVTACDMPYLNAQVVEYLFRRARGNDAAVPVGDGGVYEPLHAVYRTGSMLLETRRALEQGERFILAPIFKMEVVEAVGMDEIREFDYGLQTFVNVNTPEDVERLE
ncbi:MAG: molybdenum cofactor guanylyltransferase [ANME-2 cluster archaeon]|nr:molybdenum cofactor guanylyltransferase [ANME-2 cluster archaeon]